MDLENAPSSLELSWSSSGYLCVGVRVFVIIDFVVI